MLVDQLTLQKLHEQLTSEYDSLVKEKEALKVLLALKHFPLYHICLIVDDKLDHIRTERGTERVSCKTWNSSGFLR